ncbi:phosphatidate cytidylyltransferase [Cesiribacter andamanensis]|uniref:Phosphatidate cytidylyltransferase n=1 Tax=Cesiribacter andamanensis AMV16 TaxID=1279009 RepID=M7NAF1_9BACT|nr:Phosphatidate cytidylyltransferase [Cesiribacter andamanensis AMV16]
MISHLSRFSNLRQRIIAGVIGAAAIIFAIWFSSWTYFLVFSVICAFTLLEFYKLVGLDGHFPLKFWGTFTGLMLYTITFFIQKGLLPVQYYFLVFPLGSLIFFIKLYKRDEKKPFTNIAFTFLGVIYVAVPFSLLHGVVFILGDYSYQIILGLMLIIWASDTGAYFAGTKFGKTKLFERVSPKKSWEGFIGGAATAFLMAMVISIFYDDLHSWEWFILAGIAIVTATYGDLVESLFKRSIAIKDSGTTIPGHGGFLDRFDGLLLSVPFILTYLALF